MPHEVIQEPNPSALPSSLPDNTLSLAAKVDKKSLDDDTKQSLRSFQQAACFIAGAMIFLKDNVLLERPLKFEDVKPRLLGHWGTCPGLILIWSHLNWLIRNHDVDMLFVIGPGHGAPAALAALWLEGSLGRFYPNKYSTDRKGLNNLITKFSVPGGFPSHINPETPGSIHEGGELGYALAVSFGAVMDNPDLIVTCVVGDGEGGKRSHRCISERTIFGCMDDKELLALFSGYGYSVCIVEALDRIDDELSCALEWALSEIRHIQKRARQGKPLIKPRWPMVILRTPKGWGGPKKVDGNFIEGSFHSHQVPLSKAKTDKGHLEILGEWLGGYGVGQLLPEGRPAKSILEVLPKTDSKKLGQVKYGYDAYQPLVMPDWRPFAQDKGTQASSMKETGKLLAAVASKNPKGFRMFSPDELESNKLDAILDNTGRNFQWDEYSRAKGGRVIEILSEHSCQGFMQGYTLTGRTALFPSYESFLGIIHTMVVQYSKFNKVAREVDWRRDLSSINYIETSTWARQEHNGFSHQNPSFIGAILNLKADAARTQTASLSTVDHCLKSKNYVNLIIGSKQPTAVYLSPEDAAEHCRKGAAIWKFASSNDGKDPDVVLVGIGVEVTFEVVKAAELLRTLVPELNVRVVNVTDLFVLAAESRHPHALSRKDFIEMFTDDKPVCFNYHGYEKELQGLIFGRPGLHRMTVEGYKEEGSTTTPFDMMIVNGVSRFDLAKRALRATSEQKTSLQAKVDDLLAAVNSELAKVKDYISSEGKDPDDLYDMPTGI
ncbi:hypothetical protein ACCO45_000170 [Purpureocillium lilacinum]|uniref:Uncharacterized protein n=1 Tax=Purpureocillium lilacinum TaxID=33203 RepID=A0ACC4E3D3_PURLI